MTTDQKVLSTVRGALALIKDPSRHTQNALARDGKGNGCDSKSPRAQKWCVIGAIDKASPSQKTTEDTITYVRTFTSAVSLAWLNNGPDGHEKVCAVLRQALGETTS
jgi:hypothetical protein